MVENELIGRTDRDELIRASPGTAAARAFRDVFSVRVMPGEATADALSEIDRDEEPVPADDDLDRMLVFTVR